MKKRKAKKSPSPEATFLRNLKALAVGGAKLEEAAESLGLTEQDFREKLHEPNYGEVWQQGRLKLVLDLKKSLVRAAKAGRLVAIDRLEKILREETSGGVIGEGQAVDPARLNTFQLCQFIGKPRSTIDRWRTRYGLRRDPKSRTYSLPEVFDWFETFCQAKYSGRKTGDGDLLRRLKAARLQIELKKEQGELLDRKEMVGGLVARWRALIAGLERMTIDLPAQCEGQTADAITGILRGRFLKLREDFCEISNELHLSPVAKGKLNELLDVLIKESDHGN